MNYTYDKRLGWLNTTDTPVQVDGFTDIVGVVYRWMTRDGAPVMIPDQWERDSGMTYARLPDDVVAAKFPAYEHPDAKGIHA